MPRKENNLVLMAVGFAASTMFIVFVCTRLICAHIMQWTASRRSIPTARPRSDLSILERGLHGLEPVLIATFPTKKFSDDFFSSSEDTQCTVCLAEYQQKDTLRVLPYCGHSFHVTCIDIWLQQHSTCPICRISLRESTDRKQTMPPMFRAPLALGTIEPYWYSSQVVSSPQRELVEEDQFPSHLDMVEVREVNSMLTRDNNGVLKSKHVESPSNS